MGVVAVHPAPHRSSRPAAQALLQGHGERPGVAPSPPPRPMTRVKSATDRPETGRLRGRRRSVDLEYYRATADSARGATSRLPSGPADLLPTSGPQRPGYGPSPSRGRRARADSRSDYVTAKYWHGPSRGQDERCGAECFAATLFVRNPAVRRGRDGALG